MFAEPLGEWNYVFVRAMLKSPRMGADVASKHADPDPAAEYLTHDDRGRRWMPPARPVITGLLAVEAHVATTFVIWPPAVQNRPTDAVIAIMLAVAHGRVARRRVGDAAGRHRHPQDRGLPAAVGGHPRRRPDRVLPADRPLFVFRLVVGIVVCVFAVAVMRRGLDLKASAVRANAARAGRPIIVALFDLDELKHLNDTEGHEVADATIRDVATHWRDDLREGDVPARVGGDAPYPCSQSWTGGETTSRSTRPSSALMRSCTPRRANARAAGPDRIAGASDYAAVALMRIGMPAAPVMPARSPRRAMARRPSWVSRP